MRELLLPLEECGSCRFKYSREPGYYFGVVTPVLPILSLMTGALFAATAFFLIRTDLDGVLAAGAFGIAVGFAGFFRTAIALYIALDHAIAPPAR
jgi:hypothetical protein